MSPDEHLHSAMLARDGITLAVMPRTLGATIWNTETGKSISHDFLGQLREFSPDSKLLVVEVQTWVGDYVNLLDVRTGRVIRSYPTGIIAFSPDGKSVAGVGYSGGKRSISIWNTSTGQGCRCEVRRRDTPARV